MHHTLDISSIQGYLNSHHLEAIRIYINIGGCYFFIASRWFHDNWCYQNAGKTKIVYHCYIMAVKMRHRGNYFTKDFPTHLKSHGNTFCRISNSGRLITTIFCTYHDRIAVVTCVNIVATALHDLNERKRISALIASENNQWHRSRSRSGADLPRGRDVVRHTSFTKWDAHVNSIQEQKHW